MNSNLSELFLSFQNLEKVDEGEVLEASDDEGDNSDIEDSGDSSTGDIEEDDKDDVNPLLVNPDEKTDEATKTKLWFDKVRQGFESGMDLLGLATFVDNIIFSRKCFKVLKRWKMKISKWNKW